MRYGNELIVQEDEEKLDQAIWKLPNDSESEKNNNNIPKVKISKRTRWLGDWFVNPFTLFNFTEINFKYIVCVKLKFG